MTSATDERQLPQALPPQAETRPPSWTLPADATDSHFHVLGPQSRFGYSSARRYDVPEAPFEQWRRMADITGIRRGVVVQSSVHGVDNTAMLDAIDRAEGSLRGVIRLTPSLSRRELHQMADTGVVGARFSILSDRPGTIDEITWAAPILAGLGWSIDLHISPQALIDFADVIRALPIPVVIDHMANLKPADGLEHPAMVLLRELLVDEGGIWVKIAAVHKRSEVQAGDAAPGVRPYQDVVERARLLVATAPDRVLWGTDYPHANIFEARRIPNEGDLLDLIPEYAATPAHRNRLLVHNPARLYGFDS